MPSRKVSPELKNILTQATGRKGGIESQIEDIRARKQRELACYLAASLIRVSNDKCSSVAEEQREAKHQQLIQLQRKLLPFEIKPETKPQ